MRPSLLPVYCISLADRKDRREAMNSLSLARVFDFAFVDAIDGRQGTVEVPDWIADLKEHDIANPDTVQFPSLNGRWRWGQIKPVEQACLLSHMSIWRSVAENGQDGAIILEDDVMANGNLDLEALDEMVREGLSAYDLLYLGYSSNLNQNDNRFSFTRLRANISRLLRPSVEKDFAFFRSYRSGLGSRLNFSSYRQAGLHFGTYAYSISAEAAGELLKICSRVDIAADRALQCYVMMGKKAAVIDTPPFVTNDAFGSDIQDEAKFKRDALNNPQNRVES